MRWPDWNSWSNYNRALSRPLSPSIHRSRSYATSALSIAEPMPETGEEGEESVEQVMTPSVKIPPHNAPFTYQADDFNQFHELFRRVMTDLEVPLEEVFKSQHKLLRILNTSASSKIALPVNDALLEPANNICQTPAIIPPI